MVRLVTGLAYLAALSNTISAASLPDPKNNIALNYLEEHGASAPRSTDVVSPDHSLERRKGGGGRGGGSSGGGSGGGRSSGGGGSSSGGGARTLGSSNVGGSTRAGSGPTRSYGGGYYAGGAAVPYTAGQATRRGLPAGPLLVGAGALAIMPGLWLYSAYPYYYSSPYRFYNRTRNSTEENNNNNDARSIVIRQSESGGANETLPVVCLCQEYSVCGCEENTDQSYLDDLIGNGSYAALNKSVITVSEVNDTKTKAIVLNGTLPNGTTAPGGQDDAAAALSLSGYWVMGLIVLYGVML